MIKKYTGIIATDFKQVPKLQALMAILIILMPFLLIAGRALADAVLSITAVLFLVSSVLSKDLTWIKQKWFIFAALFWVYVSTSSFFAIDAETAFGRAFPWIRFIVFAAAVQFVLSANQSLLKYLQASVALALSFVIFDALNQYITGTGIFGHEMVGLRLTAPFDNMVVGIFLSAVSPMITAFSLHTFFNTDKIVEGKKEQLSVKTLSLIFVLLTMLTIFFSGERMALALYLMSCGILLLCYAGSIKRVLFTGGSLFAILVIAFASSKELFERHIVKTLGQFQSGEEFVFFQLFSSGFKIFLENPIIGVGLKNYRFLSAEYMNVSETLIQEFSDIHPHNYYLEVLAETGLIGMFFWLGIFVSWGIMMIKSSPLSKNPFIVGAMISVAVKLWPLCTTGSFFTNWNSSIFWLLFGVSLVLIAPNKKISK